MEGKLTGYKEQCPSLDPDRTLDTVKQELEQLADNIKSTRKACEQKQESVVRKPNEGLASYWKLNEFVVLYSCHHETYFLIIVNVWDKILYQRLHISCSSFNSKPPLYFL